MSNFKFTATHKKSGNPHEVWVVGDYFGRHLYGYIPNVEGAAALSDDEFEQEYEITEPKIVVNANSKSAADAIMSIFGYRRIAAVRSNVIEPVLELHCGVCGEIHRSNEVPFACEREGGE